MNSLAREHHKTVYSSQAVRHVAEQIDALYWASGERAVRVADDEALERGTDYRVVKLVAPNLLITLFADEALDG